MVVRVGGVEGYEGVVGQAFHNVLHDTLECNLFVLVHSSLAARAFVLKYIYAFPFPDESADI